MSTDILSTDLKLISRIVSELDDCQIINKCTAKNKETGGYKLYAGKHRLQSLTRYITWHNFKTFLILYIYPINSKILYLYEKVGMLILRKHFFGRHPKGNTTVGSCGKSILLSENRKWNLVLFIAKFYLDHHLLRQLLF